MPVSVAEASRALVGHSPQIARIRRLIEKAAATRLPVLLLGESGTGKEVVARAIHTAGGRGEFVPIDCGALVDQLMESELFGHTRGAFTGAAEYKKGLVETADGGTAFFDEIGDLRLELQVKILRLLQEREFRPVGALKQQKIDVRVIAATHRDLPRAIDEGRFRQDLYYRLNVITLRLPPLRERKEDIPELAAHFMAQTGRAYELAPDAMEALKRYGWPGNVRELQNTIQRLAAMHSGPVVRALDLPSPLQRDGWEAAAPAHSSDYPTVRLRAPGPVVSRQDAELRAIADALAFTGGDRTRAAELLHMGRTTLYRKLKKYNLAP